MKQRWKEVSKSSDYIEMMELRSNLYQARFSLDRLKSDCKKLQYDYLCAFVVVPK